MLILATRACNKIFAVAGRVLRVIPQVAAWAVAVAVSVAVMSATLAETTAPSGGNNKADYGVQVAESGARPDSYTRGEYTIWSYGLWELRKSHDAMDGDIYEVESNHVSPIPTPSPVNENAQLSVRFTCLTIGGMGAIFTLSGAQASGHKSGIHGGYEEVRYKADDEKPQTLNVLVAKGPAGAAYVSARDAQEKLSESLAGRRTLLIEILLKDHERALFRFNLAGMSDAVAELREECAKAHN